jgi:hypothetical protein
MHRRIELQVGGREGKIPFSLLSLSNTIYMLIVIVCVYVCKEGEHSSQ